MRHGLSSTLVWLSVAFVPGTALAQEGPIPVPAATELPAPQPPVMQGPASQVPEQPPPVQPPPAPQLPPLALPTVAPGDLAFTESFSVGLPSFSLQSRNTNYQGAVQYVTPSGYLAVGGLGSALDGVQVTYPTTLASLLERGSNCSPGSSHHPCVALNATLSGSYRRTFESVRYAYDLVAGLSVAPGVNSGPVSSLDNTRKTQFTLSLAPVLGGEIRWYPGPQAAEMFLYLGQVASDAFNYQHYTGVADSWNNTVQSMTRGGVGWGRVLPVGVSTRLRKLVRHLLQRGALSGPVTPEIGDEILRHWYALRNHTGWYDHVAYLEQVLRRHGLLARPLDLEEGYVTVAILQDAVLEDREQGWRADVSVAFRETAVQVEEPSASSLSYYAKPFHREQLAVDLSGRWVSRVGLDDQVDVPAVLHITPRTLDDSFPWLAFQAEPRFVKYFYSPHQDPLGRLTAGVHLLLATAWGSHVKTIPSYSSDTSPSEYVSFSHPVVGTTSLGVQGGHLMAEVGGSIQYSRTLTRGSSWQVGLNSGLQKLPDHDPGYYLGLTAGVTFGVSKGSFARF